MNTKSSAGDRMLPEGCGYQGYEFGANYPDSICCGGRLYDADNCDNEGNLYEPMDEIPCPMCREKDAIEYWTSQMSLQLPKQQAALNARSLVADIRRNRQNGTEPWKARVTK